MNRASAEGYKGDLRKELENTIWDVSTEEGPDEIHKQIDDAVAEIERICRPILTKT